MTKLLKYSEITVVVKNALKPVLDQLRGGNFIRFIFYPMTLFFTTPFRLIQSLAACRILARREWGDFSHFNPTMGLVSLFYWTHAFNFRKFGRKGDCPYMGNGRYSLSHGFHYSLASLHCFHKASNVTLLAGMFGWLLSHLIWINQVNSSWLLFIAALLAISTTFYFNVFGLQNYNSLGWALFPMGIYGIIHHQWLLVVFIWTMVSFYSTTVFLIAAILSLAGGLFDKNPDVVILVLTPGCLNILMHLYPSFQKGDWKIAIQNILQVIGVIRSPKIKYKRYIKWGKLIRDVYFLILYLQFLLVYFLLTKQLSLLFMMGLTIYFLNIHFLRFADEQSMYMLMMSLATVLLLQTKEMLLIPSYWILISPLPRSLDLIFLKNVFDQVPKFSPFYIRRLFEGMEEFLKTVRSDQKILMAFDDPQGNYNKIFDGYGILIQLPFYICSQKEILFMPNWTGIFESNTCSAPNLWGRTPPQVMDNVRYWGIDYVILYIKEGEGLNEDWEKLGFEIKGKFSWRDYDNDMKGIRPYHGNVPDWWLLKVPTHLRKEVIECAESRA